MKQLKIVLALVGLLSIGFIAGFFTHRIMAKKRIEKVRNLVRKDRFGTQLFEFIEATPEQRAQLDSLVKDNGRAMQSLYENFRKDRRELIDSLELNMAPHLTETQKAQFKEFRKHLSRKRKGKRGAKYRKEEEER